jgi:hypothetical protein
VFIISAGGAGAGGNMEHWVWGGSSWIRDAYIQNYTVSTLQLTGSNIVENISKTSEIKCFFSEYNTTVFGGLLKVYACGSNYTVGIPDPDTWRNDTWHFTTGSGDTTPPTITINFAGNLSDSGGPYYRPPGESTALSGVFVDGYYTNDSKQQEDWMYINLTVADAESPVTDVWLQWMNKTGASTVWTNYTYAFTDRPGDYWDFNTSGVITTEEGSNYSFNIVANNSGDVSNTTWWNKTGLGGSYTRRYVQLNCASTNISYTPYYLYDAIYGAGDASSPPYKRDRLHRDQGPEGTTIDTGFLYSDIPTDTVAERYCDYFVGYWFDDNVSAQSDVIENIYFHTWSTIDFYILTDQNVAFGWTADLKGIAGTGGRTGYNLFNVTSTYNRSYIYYAGGHEPNKNYTLTSFLFDVTDKAVTDNSMYNILLSFDAWNNYNPGVINNRSFTSFILFNVPDNATLNAPYVDSDSDFLSDWNELYIYYTNPFLDDTDNDAVTDYIETLSGSDPNNYTDTLELTDIIRNYGTDYMVWLGENTSAYHVNKTITGMNSASESISIWNLSTWTTTNGLWQKYNGTRTGVNWTVHTFDIVRTILADAVGNQTITMTANPDMDYTKSYARTLMKLTKNKGYNFTAYNRVAATTLSAINTTAIGLTTGDMVTRWNRTTWTWDTWISGFGPQNHAVNQWDVIQTKVSNTETWNT